MSFLSTFITFHFCNFISLFSPTIFFYMSFLFTIIATYFWSVFVCIFLNYFFQCNIYYIHIFFFFFFFFFISFFFFFYLLLFFHYSSLKLFLICLISSSVNFIIASTGQSLILFILSLPISVKNS